MRTSDLRLTARPGCHAFPKLGIGHADARHEFLMSGWTDGLTRPCLIYGVILAPWSFAAWLCLAFNASTGVQHAIRP